MPISHNVLSAALFHWVTPLMARGSKRQLQPSDLFPLPPAQQPRECAAVLWGCWQQVSQPQLHVDGGIKEIQGLRVWSKERL